MNKSAFGDKSNTIKLWCQGLLGIMKTVEGKQYILISVEVKLKFSFLAFTKFNKARWPGDGEYRQKTTGLPCESRSLRGSLFMMMNKCSLKSVLA